LLEALDASPQAAGVPPAVEILISITPVLILTCWSFAFTTVMVNALRDWATRASSAARDTAHQWRDGITRSVQQEHVSVLSREVVPFLSAVISGQQLTPADSARAQEIAESLRSTMVAGVDRSWLAATLAERGLQNRLNDPGGLAEKMNADQRTAVRAMVLAAIQHPGFGASEFAIDIRAIAPGRCVCEIVATIRGPEFTVRSEFAPYFAVLRMVFADFSVSGSHPARRLNFSYGH
jgi:hypothetical protein